MGENDHCPECGGELPADAPQGLCPQCLMKLGLATGGQASEPGAADVTSNDRSRSKPAAGFSPPEPAELAKQFPQLEIIELLGQGGMGAVYKARQKQLDRLIALKILPPEVGEDTAFAERFTREARSMAMLSHPRIVTVHDFGQTEAGLYYFIMEFVDGTDLRHVIKAGELSPDEALLIVPQICEALHFAHEEGIVHRDIKPENVLLDKKGRVKIADFGLARLLDRPSAVYTLTHPAQRMGTPHYMAPEQIEHPHEVDHRADIYSLGVVFYEMLTGELPIGRFAPPSQKVRVDVRLDQVVLHTLEKEPERRYQHVSEIKTDVEAISSGGEPAPLPARATSQRAKSPGTLFGLAIREHLKIVAIVRIAWGILGIVIAVTVFALVAGTGIATGDSTATAILLASGGAIALFPLVLSVPDVIAGVGLLKRRRWARILALIMGVLDLPLVPIGTATGIYTIYVLMREETAELFAPALAEKEGEPDTGRFEKNEESGPSQEI
ncbi:MAG: protein kinase [Phycisphaerales bacterium]|nr:MAG: protein kinase [Phycisphaerales bacterium]